MSASARVDEFAARAEREARVRDQTQARREADEERLAVQGEHPLAFRSERTNGVDGVAVEDDLADLAGRIAHLPAGWHLTQPAPRPMVLYPYLPRGKVSALLGAGAVCKTLLETEWAANIVTGSCWRGHPSLQGDVTIVTWEDECSPDYHAKFYSLLRARSDLSESHELIRQRIHFVELQGSSLYLVSGVDGKPVTTRLARRLASLIRREFPDTVQVFIETVSRANAADETNEAMARVVDAGEIIAHRLNCGVTVVHHVTKAAALSGLLDAHSGRGGSSLVDNCRATTVVAVVTSSSDRRLWPSGFEAPDFEGREIVLIDNVRSSYGRRAERMHLERVYPETGAPFLRAVRPPMQELGDKPDKEAAVLMAWLCENAAAAGLTERAIRDRRGEYGLAERAASSALARLVKRGAIAANVERQYGSKGRLVERFRTV
jgi:hypothetical protein